VALTAKTQSFIQQAQHPFDVESSVIHKPFAFLKIKINQGSVCGTV
jgi:hypothetical protein